MRASWVLLLLVLSLALLAWGAEDAAEAEMDESSGEDAGEEGASDEEDQDDPKAMMQKMDTNQDGKLSMEELHAEIQEADEEEMPEEFKGKLAEFFKQADKDGDTLLDGEELPELIRLFENDDEDL